MPNVSIIIPTYNRAEFIAYAIRSALLQQYNDFEVIVVDDGSTDQTRELVEAFQSPRLRYVYQENQGKGAAINHGLSLSNGQWINKLDSDDWLLPGGILALINYLDLNPEVDIAVGGYNIVDQDGQFQEKKSPWQSTQSLALDTWLTECPVLWQGALVRKECLEKIGGFDPDIMGPDDWDVGIRLAHIGCKMEWVKEQIFCYRHHSGMSVRNTEFLQQEMIYILDKFFQQEIVPPEINAQKRELYAKAYLNIAGRQYTNREYRSAGDALLAAIELNPLILENRGILLRSTVAWWARGYRDISNQEQFINYVVNHLPKDTKKYCSIRSITAEMAVIEFFLAKEAGEPERMQQSLVKILLSYPQRLIDNNILQSSVKIFLRLPG